MRSGKWIIGILSVLLLGLILVVSIQEGTTQKDTITEPICSVWIGTGNKAEEIDCWEDPDGKYYVFLPGYAELNECYLVPREIHIAIENVSITDTFSCEGIELEREYAISLSDSGKTWSSTLMFVQSGGIPSMYIDTASGNMDYIHMEKGNEEAGSVRLYDDEGALLYSGGIDAIKGRGNSSWAADKKPYSMVLGEDANLLGMGTASRWVLLAEGFCSNVNIRNKLVYDYAQSVGMNFSPEGEWVDLYLNGDYAGLYLLSERNEVHSERVDIDPETGFLVSMEWDIRLQEQKLPHILTDAGQTLRIHQSAMSLSELDEQWQYVENAILAEDGIDPLSGKHWQELIDLDSWAEKYLLEEIFGNHDGGSFSQFYYYDPALDPERIFAGPIWDYDMAMGGYDVWLKPYTRYFIMNREYKEDGLYTPWYHALYEKAEFRRRVEELYVQKFLPALEMLLEYGMEDELSLISRAHQQDARRWGHEWEDVQTELNYIRSYLTDRAAFLSDVWIKGTQYHIVRVDPGRNEVYGYFAVKSEECLPELSLYEDPLNLGWHIEETDEPFDVTQPIYGDVQIYMKKAAFQIPKIHYLPVVAIMAMLPILAFRDWSRIKKNGRVRHDTAKIK